MKNSWKIHDIEDPPRANLYILHPRDAEDLEQQLDSNPNCHFTGKTMSKSYTGPAFIPNEEGYQRADRHIEEHQAQNGEIPESRRHSEPSSRPEALNSPVNLQRSLALRMHELVIATLVGGLVLLSLGLSVGLLV